MRESVLKFLHERLVILCMIDYVLLIVMGVISLSIDIDLHIIEEDLRFSYSILNPNLSNF